MLWCSLVDCKYIRSALEVFAAQQGRPVVGRSVSEGDPLSLVLRSVVVLVVLVLTACNPSGPSSTGGSRPSSSAPGGATGSAPKSIVIGLDEDIANLWDVIQGGGGTGAREMANIVNQHLVAITSDGSPTPRLLAELPSFDKGTWRLLPDGRMETTYKLRTDALWHDGTPFTAKDLIFSWQVCRDPDVPNANQEAVRIIDQMEATDQNTVVATWSTPYPFADRLEHRELYPLPAHLLERSYQDAKENFLFQPFFTEGFVGVGPYKLTRWERGSHVELAAFDRFFLGRAKIDTIRIQFIPDQNTMLANLRAKSLNAMLTLGSVPDFDAMMVLKREWEGEKYGTVIMDPISYRFIEPQYYHSPSPPDLNDRRVREALIVAIDRPELARVAFAEAGIVADAWLHPSFKNYPLLQDAMTRYPKDMRRAQALLQEAGWQMAGGSLQKNGQPFHLTMRDADGVRDVEIISAQWRELGLSTTYEQRNAVALRDRKDRATFTGVDVTSNPMGLAAVTRRSASYNIPTEENRWTGTNRGGYQNPAWDDLDQRLLVALDDKARLDIERDMLRLYTADLALLPLYFRNDLVPMAGGLTGVIANTGTAHRGFILHSWNVADWDMQSRR
jgi:peptide/nickel transport system substrate-binding protein